MLEMSEMKGEKKTFARRDDLMRRGTKDGRERNTWSESQPTHKSL